MYLDANNLYGHSMMQHLPTGDFEWCNEAFSSERISDLKDDAEIGYIFDVDLDYPQHLHNKHRDYPFCPENRIVPGTQKEKKLLLTLFDKKNYVIHMRMLKLALKQGLVLKKNPSCSEIRPGIISEAIRRIKHSIANRGNERIRKKSINMRAP